MKYIILLVITISIISTVNATKVLAQKPSEFFRIMVVDDQTGKGVPLVELSTTNNISYYTDNNGIVAFYEPGLMNQKVYFHLKSHGYQYHKDGFGYSGIALETKPGDSAVIEITRINIAERLYRITGQGMYYYSELVGFQVPDKLTSSNCNGKVMGQDSYNEVVYKGKLFWFWGDTGRPGYPLGNFRTSGATSELPGEGGLDPSVGIALNYFVGADGFSKQMFPNDMPGPIWMSCMVVLKDKDGTERLVGSYARIKNLGEAYERGIAIYNDSAEIFEPLVQFDLDFPLFPEGHPFLAVSEGKEYLYFSSSVPYTFRVPADLEHFTNPEAYEAYTCLAKGSKYNKSSVKLDRNPDGSLAYSWKTKTAPLTSSQQVELIETGQLKREEALVQLQDIATGNLVQAHSGTVFWNEYRKRWVMIFQQIWGTSILGEVWYAEGDSPLGPWVYSTKIVTHDNYSFYNVGQHTLFDQEGGRLIYFEGTYTKSFTDNPVATPRYDYNQMMYRIDLNDSRLYLPVPVYHISNAKEQPAYALRETVYSLDDWNTVKDIPFFALAPNRYVKGTIAIHLDKAKGRLKAGDLDARHLSVFYALPAESAPTDSLFALGNLSNIAYLYEYQNDQGDYIYSTLKELKAMKRSEKPICRVWRNPSTQLNLDYSAKPISFR